MKIGSTKKQHYVPRFYMKNFANDNKQFNVIDIFKKKCYNNVPYMNQCYENYFYDKDNKWENELGILEVKWSTLINKIICEDYYPSEDEKIILKEFAMFQKNRTKYHSEELKSLIWTNLKVGVELEFNSKNKYFDELEFEKLKDDFLKDKMQNVIQESLEMSRSACKHINDLELCIIKYNTKKKLISSDNPIINYNNFYFRSTGYDNAGIIIFFPISSEILIVIYDSKMYTGNDNKKLIISNNEYEVKYLNYYQILNSNGLIFYKDSEMTKELITSLNNNKIKKYLKYNKNTPSVIGPPNEKIIMMQSNYILLQHNFTFAQLPLKARAIPQNALDWFPRKYDKKYKERMHFREKIIPNIREFNEGLHKGVTWKENDAKTFNTFVLDYWKNNL
ncbi:MAG: DUF4238 domain-containing protein [Bacilli bacterium]|jgi:hypothetical protein|nr:DUF4238 domain-containing protein [Bacilli bacterium]